MAIDFFIKFAWIIFVTIINNRFYNWLEIHWPAISNCNDDPYCQMPVHESMPEWESLTRETPTTLPL